MKSSAANVHKSISCNILAGNQRMNIKTAYNKLKSEVAQLYDAREAASIASMVLNHITGITKTQWLVNDGEISENDQKLLQKFTKSLLDHTPVQYVLNEAWFYGLRFIVNKNVLIPRPETEELVQWVIDENKTGKIKTLLDVGTGSGCIAISLKHKLPWLKIDALDISAPALKVAKSNAVENMTAIQFYQIDFFDSSQWNALSTYDYIVSNPPYIKLQEAREMQPNVMNHEPHVALFVKDDDHLIFYRLIIQFAEKHLHPGGKLFFEINEQAKNEMEILLGSNGFTKVEVRKDMQGKPRMVMAVK